MIGNDMKLDTGIGTCGKKRPERAGGRGPADLAVDGLTVGGTAA